ncbi:LOW QUALITY PROTEIN: probable G-protein coupled receptor 158 [Megalobrama amblycephala]|uniref:LOW QUALITY PROTEIN: probable G-protein coupled receptor 158 n=1 Tax=Megalobrama amblycephala TaxID=75352 RepID=UPI002013CD25|nr:LOW QUALITY PROTEIN: probable G-protein coupled receptor 158 [Megalobrama amblycephala]
MAIIRISLLLQVGFVIGSNYRYAEQERDLKAKLPIYNTHSNQQAHLRKPHSGLAQKIEEQVPRVVTAFLHTGDSSTLKHANCSRRYELAVLRGRTRGDAHHSMRGVLDTVLHATNFLNMILQTNRSRDQSPRRDMEWYHALVRSILEGDLKIHRAVVTLSSESPPEGPPVYLQATRAGGEIILQDLSSTAHRVLKNRTADTEWYHEHKNKKKTHLQKRVLSQDFASFDASVRNGESYITDKTQIHWSSPYLECENGNFIPRWLLTLSAGFYGLKSNRNPDFRGVVRVDVSLQDVDIDQCSADGWFAGTHRCNLTTMECLPIPGHGFVLDKYKCHCKSGFYHPSRVAVNGFKRKGGVKGTEALSHHRDVPESSSHCLPCQEGCDFCKDNTPCVARGDGALRMAVLSFQGLCMLVDFISMVLLYHFRRNKSIRASGLILLEAIMFGALLLYFPVVILYFQPSVFRCILLRWVRLLGFATVYGTVTLKLYRVLKVFLSRTAQRIPYMTSWRVLRLLCIILLIVLWFAIAWTAAVCQNPNRHLALISVGFTTDGLQFSMCLLDRWDYMIAVAEFLFLLWGVYLCFAVRTVPSAFHEPRYMAIAVHNELILSAIFHILRFTLAPELHPDWMLMLFFAHTHLTVTVTLGLLLVPKFLFAGTQLRDDIATEAYEDELDMGRSGSYLNSSITSAWSEHSLDPEDIRTPEEMGQLSSINGCGVRSCDSLWEKRTNEELKKLYSQLEIYKRKKMLANNPHLQKKRSSKKGLGRSLMRRITEIPESMGRQCSREDKDLGEHGSNRNSICVLRKNPFDPSHSVKPAKDESLKSKVFSLKKSHSSYDHVRDHSEDSSSSATDKMEVATTEGSLLETLMGKKLVKKSSEKIDAASESTESVPLVCKSASAHNLTADKKPIHPRTSMLQKSLSVIASAKEKTLGLTGKAQAAEDTTKKANQKNKDAKTPAEAEENEGYPKMIVSQSVEYKQTAAKTGIMKPQMSGSQPSICSETAKGKDLYDLSEVCPWELEDLPTPSENKVQKHVSIAPEQTTTVHGSSNKATKSQQQKQKGTEQSPSVTRRPNQKVAERTDICPWEEGNEDHSQAMGPKPHSNSKPAMSQPQASGEVAKVPKAEVCPWDFEEVSSKPKDSACSPDQSRPKKGTTPTEIKGKISSSPTEAKGKGNTPTEGKVKSVLSEPTKSTGSSLQPPSKADVCPWDFETVSGPISEKTPCSSQVSKTKETHAIKRGTSPVRILELERENTKGPDDDKMKTNTKDKFTSGKTKERPVSQSKLAEVCPWDVESSQEIVSTEKQKSPNVALAKSKQADVCPWDFEDAATSKDVNKSTSSSTGKQKSSNSKGRVTSGVKMADVCPWDFDSDQASTKKA